MYMYKQLYWYYWCIDLVMIKEHHNQLQNNKKVAPSQLAAHQREKKHRPLLQTQQNNVV